MVVTEPDTDPHPAREGAAGVARQAHTTYRFTDETVHIHRLETLCIIGIRPHERETPQPLWIDIAFPLCFAAAAEQSSLEQTIDYAAVAKSARQFVQAGRFYLLETLARALGSHLCQQFQMQSIRLHIQKPRAIAGSAGPAVSLTVHRERSESD